MVGSPTNIYASGLAMQLGLDCEMCDNHVLGVLGFAIASTISSYPDFASIEDDVKLVFYRNHVVYSADSESANPAFSFNGDKLVGFSALHEDNEEQLQKGGNKTGSVLLRFHARI